MDGFFDRLMGNVITVAVAGGGAALMVAVAVRGIKTISQNQSKSK